jgi:hypothetical protein
VANALASETSPYLRQHACNPVDWRPWGEDALRLAHERSCPLIVSIGYSACHWCHVMERESFADERVAQFMNERFVCVKVDREERPDVDAIYMEAVQAMTGQGGWPLNVFLTPEQLPFYGGTYFPPQPGRGMPSWMQVLEAIAEEWDKRADEIREAAERFRGRLAGGAQLQPSASEPDPRSLDTAVAELRDAFDWQHGGFGGAPKFPQAPVIELLLAEGALGNAQAGEMALRTLNAIAAGGIHDLVGGGFHRYAVDATWTVPHFEKMLYDNALLARASLRGYMLGGDRGLLDACLDTLAWTLREMQGPEGGFYAALDADSEGVEGAFYVWTVAELRETLDEDAEAAIAWTGASTEGNFVDHHHPLPGLNVLREAADASAQAAGRPDAQTAARIKAALLARREGRVRPALDDKRITAWNALMISALAETAGFLGVTEVENVDPTLANTLLDAAQRCAELLLTRMRDAEGRLLRTFDGETAKLPAYLEDHAFLIEALIALYEASFEERWLLAARELAEETIARFADEQHGGFFSTAADSQPLIARRKDLEDSPIPAGASSIALSLLRLHAFTGQARYERHAAATLSLLQEIAPNHPSAFGHLLQALRLLVSPGFEVAIVGPAGAERDALLRVVRERLRRNVVLAASPGDGTPSAVPLLQGRTPLNGRPAAYVCRRFSCQMPVSEPQELAALLA